MTKILVLIYTNVTTRVHVLEIILSYELYAARILNIYLPAQDTIKARELLEAHILNRYFISPESCKRLCIINMQIIWKYLERKAMFCIGQACFNYMIFQGRE